MLRDYLVLTDLGETLGVHTENSLKVIPTKHNRSTSKFIITNGVKKIAVHTGVKVNDTWICLFKMMDSENKLEELRKEVCQLQRLRECYSRVTDLTEIGVLSPSSRRDTWEGSTKLCLGTVENGKLLSFSRIYDAIDWIESH